MAEFTYDELAVLRVLRDRFNRYNTVQDIAFCLGVSETKARQDLRTLKKRGLVVCEESRWYASRGRWRGEWSRLEHAGVIARAFADSQRAAWPMWPMACCMVSSLPLATLLRASLEWDLAVAVGVVRHYRMERHAWLESPEGDIIDPTYGQFDGGPAVRILPAYRSGELGHWAEVRLSLAQEEFYRNSIRARSGNDSGWDPGCRIDELFSDWPIARNAATIPRLKR